MDASADVARARALVHERLGPGLAVDQAVAGESELGALDQPLTIERACALALRNNPELQRTFLEIGVARAELVQSTLFTNPSLALSGMFPDAGGRSKLDVGLAQQIADLWQIPIRKRVAAAELEAAILRAAESAIQLVGQVRARGYELLALQAAEGLARVDLELAQRIVARAEAQHAAGQISAFDVNLTRATLIDAEQNAIAVQGELRHGRAELAHLLGIGRTRPDWDLAGELRGPEPLPDDERLVEQAGRQRFESQVAAWRVRAAEDTVRREYAAVLADVEIGVELERPEARALPGRQVLADAARSSLAAGQLTAPDLQTRGQRAQERAAQIDALVGPTLALTLPVWDQNQAQIAKARTRALQARQELEATLDRLALEVHRTAAAARTAGELVRFYRERAVPQAEQTLAEAEEVFAAGAEDVLVVLQAQQTLIRRRRAYLESLRDHAVAYATLEAAVGGRLEAAPATDIPATAPANAGSPARVME